MKGEIAAELQHHGHRGITTCQVPVVVTREPKGRSLLGWETSKRLGLIHAAHAMASPCSAAVTALKEEYADIFNGVRMLKGVKVKPHINTSEPPVAQPQHRDPFHVRNQVEKQLEDDKEWGIIKTASGPTPWVSPVVIIPQQSPGKIEGSQHGH